MKLRIQGTSGGNSIRLRLGRSEVERFAASHAISESVDFGSGQNFTYTLAAGSELKAVSTPHALSISVPLTLAQEWAASDQVSIEGDIALDFGKKLQILVEKDFKCIHKGEDTNQDAYPNPLATSP